ncbi:hypothetical protein IMAU60055_03139 [Lactiplantibacillus plantarum]|nr:hypothetical protein [Lactiplantibacillus plantarum]
MQMNYNSVEHNLTVKTPWKSQPNSVAWVIDALVNDIPDKVAQSMIASTGRPAYPVRLLSKLFLFGYLRHNFLRRKLARMTTDNLVMCWFVGENISILGYRIFNRFRSDPRARILISSMYQAFRDLFNHVGIT